MIYEIVNNVNINIYSYLEPLILYLYNPAYFITPRVRVNQVDV